MSRPVGRSMVDALLVGRPSFARSLGRSVGGSFGGLVGGRSVG